MEGQTAGMLGRRGVRAYVGHIRSTRLSRAYPFPQIRKVLGPCPDDRTFPCVEDFFPTAAPVGWSCSIRAGMPSPGAGVPWRPQDGLECTLRRGRGLSLRLASKPHGCSGGRSCSSWAGIPPRGAEKPPGGPRTALSAPCGEGEVCPCVWPASPTAAPVAGPAPLGRGMPPPGAGKPHGGPRTALSAPRSEGECLILRLASEPYGGDPAPAVRGYSPWSGKGPGQPYSHPGPAAGILI